MLIALLLSLTSILGTAQPPVAAPPASKAAAPVSHHLKWTIDGVDREAIIFTPPTAATAETPVVFAFHGHGGNARNSANTFNYQKHWPEAICVYMQGLPTPGVITDPDGKRNGWQKAVGDQGDRDLKFFDAVLAALRKDYKVDERRIYVTGHSNGGAFTYLLWSARPDVFAAVAPSAGGIRDLGALKPKPAMHIAGTEDTTVPFQYQKRVMDTVRRVNGCDDKGVEWAKDCTLYASKSGTPFVSLIYAGTHKFPAEAPALIVRFFKENARPAAAPTEKKADADPNGAPPKP